MAGMLSIVTLTSTLGAFSQLVGDKERESISDFMVSPVSDMQLIDSYALCAVIVGVMVTTAATIMSALFLLVASGDPLMMTEILKMSGILLLGVVMSTSMAMFIVSSLKTINAFATVSTIVGTLIGFLTGMYVPVGILPGIVQKIIYIFPVSHISMLLRQVLMERPLQMVFANSIPEETAIYKTTYGVVYNLFGEGQAITTQQSLIYIVAVTLIFFALSLLTIRKNLKSA
jgi:multidrug/hemolysin transport system permease protein